MKEFGSLELKEAVVVALCPGFLAQGCCCSQGEASSKEILTKLGEELIEPNLIL